MEFKNWNEEYESMLKDIRNRMEIAKEENNIEAYEGLKETLNTMLQVSRTRDGDYIEPWKDIEGFEGYQVSMKGRIRSLKGKEPKILKFGSGTGGYLKVDLRKDNKTYTKRVHKLVAETFIPNPEGKTEVNHINGDKTDNRYFNLEWVSRSENIKHAVNTGLYFSKDILDNRPCICLNNGAIYPSINIASTVFGLNPKEIWKNCNEKIEFVEAYGNKYYFQYAIIVDNVENKIKNPFNLPTERV